MKVNYSDQKVLKENKSIFLAGPTPRSLEVQTWRKEAIKILEELGFDGVVYVPEREFDDRTFDYNNQVWWEREALHNASVIVFWVPRNVETMPAFTTNVEFGYWMAKDTEKVRYGRPDDSEKNRYLDWLYQTETNRNPATTLEDVLKEAVVAIKQRAIDCYELNIINKVMKKYPEITSLIGDVEFTPESFGTDSETKTYGEILFTTVNSDELKKFNRTVLSVLLYFYIKDGKYDKFVEQQPWDNKLSKDSFDKLRYFMLTNFNTPEKEELLLYYMVINDLGKSQKMTNALKEKGIETVDHDAILQYLLEYDMLPSLKKFEKEQKQNLLSVLENGINVGQFIQGECVAYSFSKIENLSEFERVLMMAEAILDIGGVLGHINNKNGSAVLNQSTVDNLMLAQEVIEDVWAPEKIFDEFLNRKANALKINRCAGNIKKAITRICLMMRLYKEKDVDVVQSELLEYSANYKELIRELNETGYEQPAILLYYAPAMLSNAYKFFQNAKGHDTPLSDALDICLPFMQRTFRKVRETMDGGGESIITVMLREAALITAEEPLDLYTLHLKVLNDCEAVMSKKQYKTEK